MDLSNYQRQVYDMTGETTGPHTNSWRCGGNSANDNYGEANMFRYGTQKVPGGPFTGVLDTTGGSTPPLWVTYPEGVQYNKIFEFDRTDEFTNLKFRRYPY
jgi:hypothetical protein